MNPQEEAILGAVSRGEFRFDAPFLTNADVVHQVQVGARVLGGPVAFKGQFESTKLKNWLIRGYFAPFKRPLGVRNYLYSGADVMALLTMEYLTEFGFPVELASHVATEIRDKLMLSERWDGNLDSEDHRLLAISRTPFNERGALVEPGNVAPDWYMVTLPDFTNRARPDLVEWLNKRGLAGAFFMDWKFVAKCAISVTKEAWVHKAERLIVKQGGKA